MNERQKQLRLFALELMAKMERPHSGRVLSAIDLMEAWYFGEDAGKPIFNYNPLVPQWEERDIFVLSKLEALPALYAVLHFAQYTLPAALPELPTRKIPGIEVSAVAHAHGLSASVGLAQAMQMDRQHRHVFCLLGDYELRHGEAWEAIMTAAERKLDRLCLIVDENDPQDLMLQERFEAFGWKVIKLPDAHDHDEIAYAYVRARLSNRKPTVILARSIKSKGVPFAERKPEYDDTVFSEVEMQEIRSLLI